MRQDTARQLLHTRILMSKILNGYGYYKEDGTDLTEEFLVAQRDIEKLNSTFTDYCVAVDATLCCIQHWAFDLMVLVVH